MDTIARIGPVEQIARMALVVGVGVLRAAGRVLLNAVETLMLWQARASTRTRMAELSDHLRKDMGIGEGDVFRESSKPFWKG
jgi:uncharacterized protein YjiS (DUF1127 family)